MDTVELRQICERCRVSDPDAFLERCAILYRLLTEASHRDNLTSITEEHDFWTKHVIDSLMLGSFFPEVVRTPGLRLADIGCGAGFPSLVLAGAYPEINVTAIDSAGKKIAFVRTAAQELGLERLNAEQGRANEMSRMPDWRGRFDIVTARAVGSSCELVRDTSPMLKANGQYIFYKTPRQAEEELAKLEKSAKPPRVWSKTATFELPGGTGFRTFLFSSPIPRKTPAHATEPTVRPEKSFVPSPPSGHTLIGNGFPTSLIRRKVVITPYCMFVLRTALTGSVVHSFWGHENTLEAANRLLGIDLTPNHERPALDLNENRLPVLDEIEFRECWILSPNYDRNLRPEIGEEIPPEEIVSWQVLRIEWI